MKRDTDQDIYSYVRDTDEKLLYQYENCAKSLRREGVRQFFIPAGAAGTFLIFLGILLTRLFSSGAGGKLAPVLCFLGMLLACTAVLFLAMFLRRARQAEGTRLYISNKNVIFVDHGTYAKMPLCDISSACLQKPARLSRLPFDLSSLEGEYLVLEYRGAPMKIPFVENAEHAAEKINELVG